MVTGQFTDLAFVAGSQGPGDLRGRRGIIEVQGKVLVRIVGARFEICRSRRQKGKGQSSAGEKAHLVVVVMVVVYGVQTGGKWNPLREARREQGEV